MKRSVLTTTLLIVLLGATAQEPLYDKVFFANSRMPGNYFYSELSWSSPSWIRNVNKRFPVCDSIFFTPGNCLQLNYVSGKDGKWEARIINKPVRGMDHFTVPVRLEMKLFVASATTTDQLPLISIGNKKLKLTDFIPLGKYINSYTPGKWLNVSIPLSDFRNIQLETINEVDVISLRQQTNEGKEHNIFIDDVEFTDNDTASVKIAPAIATVKGYEKHTDISWKAVTDPAVKYIKIYRSTDGENFRAVGIQLPTISRYADYTDTTGKKFFYRISLLDRLYNESALSATAHATTAPMTDEQLLDMVQEASLRYYWEGAEKTSGLALENIHGRRNMIATGASGFGIMAMLAGAERKFITREALVERFEKITAFLERADKFHGAFPHFLDGPSGKTDTFFGSRDNGADLVETSFLMQGLLAAKQYFNKGNDKEKDLSRRIDKLWRNVEWNWFRKDSTGKFLIWHWSPDQGWVMNHSLIGWNETMITYVLAICSPTHSVPPSLYYSGWASQSKAARNYRKGWSNTSDGSGYTNGNTYYGIPLKVGVSNGGPLFFIHYSYLGLDPNKMIDAYTDYFSNNKNIALINYRYCIENPKRHQGYSAEAWGLTASDGLWTYTPDEPVPHQDHGKITPTGALASFPYTPNESMAALKNYYRNYGKFAWGEYGFKDALNLDENWCSEIFMGLNQAPVTVMIENYRSGLIWNLFMSNPEIIEGVNRIRVTPTK